MGKEMLGSWRICSLEVFNKAARKQIRRICATDHCLIDGSNFAQADSAWPSNNIGAPIATQDLSIYTNLFRIHNDINAPIFDASHARNHDLVNLSAIFNTVIQIISDERKISGDGARH